MNERSDDRDRNQAAVFDGEATAPGIPSLASGPRLKAAAPNGRVIAPIEPPAGRPAFAESERLSGYQLFDQIASGGMGTIHLAARVGSEGFRRVVAVKRLHAALLRDREHIDMFIDEASIGSHVDHPFVRHVLDFGQENGAHFMAMEFIEGEPLSAIYEVLVGDNPPPRPERHAAVVARIVADLCAGLEAVHGIEDGTGELLEVVHRDISPPNLFVLHDGTVRVSDLGVARARGRRRQTTGRRLKGKLAYMAPEYIAQQECDRRSDIWSMGVVLWELLTGKRLFRRASEALTLQAVLEDAVAPPSAHDSSISPELDRLVSKALARDPAKRPESARELGDELEAHLVTIVPPVTRAEVASWLGRLLPGSRERLRRLVRTAKTAPLGPCSAPERAPARADRRIVPRALVRAALVAALVALLASYWLLR